MALIEVKIPKKGISPKIAYIKAQEMTKFPETRFLSHWLKWPAETVLAVQAGEAVCR